MLEDNLETEFELRRCLEVGPANGLTPAVWYKAEVFCWISSGLFLYFSWICLICGCKSCIAIEDSTYMLIYLNLSISTSLLVFWIKGMSEL